VEAQPVPAIEPLGEAATDAAAPKVEAVAAADETPAMEAEPVRAIEPPGETGPDSAAPGAAAVPAAGPLGEAPAEAVSTVVEAVADATVSADPMPLDAAATADEAAMMGVGPGATDGEVAGETEPGVEAGEAGGVEPPVSEAKAPTPPPAVAEPPKTGIVVPHHVDQHAALDQNPMVTPMLVKQRQAMAGLMELHGIRMLEIEGTTCMVRDRSPAHTTRTTILLRRGSPEQSRNWFAGAGSLGPVVIVGMEPWTKMELNVENAADEFIRILDLKSRKAEVCITGGSGGSFAALLIGAMLAERLPGITVKAVAFSLVTWLYRRDNKGEHYWPHMIADYKDRPATLAGMRKYAQLRPFFERTMATPGTDLRVKAFTTPVSPMDWTQLSYIIDLPCVRYEEVMTDDYNHDMMAWTVLPQRDNHVFRAKLMQWMQIRNPNWPRRTLETRVDREVEVAMQWRKKYPDLATIFTGF
jgi:hypothetical protein